MNNEDPSGINDIGIIEIKTPITLTGVSAIMETSKEEISTSEIPKEETPITKIETPIILVDPSIACELPKEETLVQPIPYVSSVVTYICPKCQNISWKTKVKHKSYKCRKCGFIKNV